MAAVSSALPSSIGSTSLANPVSVSLSNFERSRLRSPNRRPYSFRFLRCSASPPPPIGPDEEIVEKFDGGISFYDWCAGLGTVGFAETIYLTFLKITNSEVVCPVGGGGCGDVLSSDYALVFGIPLPLYGALAYGLVAFLGFQLSRKKSVLGLGETEATSALLFSTTTMATASSYFLYLLSTKFSGTSCPYCLLSAALSFALFFITMKDFGFREIKRVGGVQLVIAGLVVAVLSSSYSTAELPAYARSNEIELEPYEVEITTESTPFAVSLASHLRAVGAKMYGAFWCSHCLEQKQMFGREAMKIVNYVECFPEGAGKGKKMLNACSEAGVEGFPTWIINGQTFSGEQELSDLAEASGFTAENISPSP